MSQRKLGNPSNIPLRRSNSSSHIPRLSRPAVRNSNIPSRNSRSSSARSTISNSNLLSVYSSGTLGRSSSYSNLLTPSQRVVCSTPTSSTSKDRKLNDKDWSRIQLQKVKGFFLHLDPEMPALKPLSIRVYVHSMNLLFKMLDGRISITIENYKDSVPEYLKVIKYPYQLKPSVMKSPAVPSSWQYVFQIWIWLVELLELLQNSERVLYPCTADELSLRLFYTGMYYMAGQFYVFNKESDEQDPKIASEELINTLAEIYNYDRALTKAAEEEEAFLDSELSSLAQALGNSNAELTELKRKKDEKSDSNSQILNEKIKRRDNILTKLRELHMRNKNLQMSVMKEKQSSESLKSVISGQPCTKYELDCAKKKVGELNHMRVLKDDRLKIQTESIAQNNVKITQERERLVSMVFKINNKIASLSCKGHQLQQLQISENDLSRPDLLDHLKDFAEKKKLFDATLEKKLHNLQAQLREKQHEKRIDILKVEALKSEMQKIDKIDKDQIGSQEDCRKKFKKVIKKKECELMEKEKELAFLKSQRPDVDKIKRQLEASLERQRKLKCTVNETMANGEDFFIGVYNSIKKSMETQQEILLGVHNAVEAVLDIGLEAQSALTEEK